MSVKQPKVTVYIVSKNYGQFLKDAVESVLRQNYDDWELLIIDDKSSDNTAQVMNLYRGDSRIRLFHTEGIGLPAVCNLALRNARGDYIVRLDGDDIFDENALHVLTNILDRNPDIALVFPDYFLMDEFGEVFAHERRNKIGQQNHLMDVPANGACTLVRRAIVDALGGYREDLGAQDGFDLWSKIVDKYKCANVNLPLFYYRRHGENLTRNSYRIMNARRAIKRDAILNSLSVFRPFTAVIPCRRNYDFVQDVWKNELADKTLLENSIRNCLASTILDHIVVACDNPEAEEIVKKFKDPRLSFFLRKQEDTSLSRSIVPTLEKIIDPFDKDRQGVTILSYVQAPFVTTETLEEAIFTLVMNQTDCSIGVQEIKTHLLQRTPYGLRSINATGELITDFSAVYAEANTALATRNRNLKTGSLTGPSVVSFIVSPNECLFINSDHSLKVARIISEEEKPA